LQNFAGGVILLILKPFRVGDFIEAQGFTGSVAEMQIFHTVLNTPDNKRVIIPNGALSAGSMINYSAEPKRRVDWTFGIDYKDNIDQAKEIILKVLNSDERVLKDPEPFVAIGALADSSVNITTRAWVMSPDYWDVFFLVNEAVKKEFDKQGITIPFPQLTYHIVKD
jgi:small conductance mechanosensitive channel